MGSIAVTTGTVRVRDCPEVKSILKALDGLGEGMDERRVESRKANRRKYGPGVMEVEIYISGHTSASHSLLHWATWAPRSLILRPSRKRSTTANSPLPRSMLVRSSIEPTLNVHLSRNRCRIVRPSM